MTRENPLRPRSRQRPKRLLSEAELQKYGLRRMRPPLEPAPAVQSSSSRGKVRQLALLVWNGPALILARLSRPRRSP